MAKYKRFQPWMLNGHPGNVSVACKRYIVRAVNAGLVVTATTNGQHATGSYHYPRRIGRWVGKGRAVDVGLPARLVGTDAGLNALLRFQRREYSLHRSRYSELIGPSNRACVLRGRIARLAEGSSLETQHDNHVHGAPRW